MLNQEHSGKIIYADMNNLDDTHPLADTQQIYMATGFGQNLPQDLHLIDDDILRLAESELNKIAGINQDQENNVKFYHRAVKEDGIDDVDEARLDFIRSRNGDVDNVDQLEISKKPPKYLNEFLKRIGEYPIPKMKKTKVNHIQKWFLASKFEKVFIYRPKKDLIKLYNKVNMKSLPENDNNTRKYLIDGILRNALWDLDQDEEFEGIDDVYNLRISNIPCACHGCLSGNVKECVSPFKKYMHSRVEALPLFEKETEETM